MTDLASPTFEELKRWKRITNRGIYMGPEGPGLTDLGHFCARLIAEVERLRIDNECAKTGHLYTFREGFADRCEGLGGCGATRA